MVTIRLKPIEVQEVLIWGQTHREKQEETGIAWESQQEDIMKKIRVSYDKQRRRSIRL